MYILFIRMYFSTASSNIFILIFRYRVFIHWIMLNGYILYFRSPTEPPPGKEPCVNSWGFYSLLPTMWLLWTEFGFKVTNLSTLFFNFLSFGPRKAVETASQKLIQNFSKFIPYLVNSLHSPETRVWDPAIPKSSSALLRSALRVKRDLEVSRWPHVNWQHDFIDWFNLRSCAPVPKRNSCQAILETVQVQGMFQFQVFC